MSPLRAQPSDPRTVARDIPGICETLFPQLAPGVVMHLNRKSWADEESAPVSNELIGRSAIQHAMLFEIAVAAGEQLVRGEGIHLDAALSEATSRQRKHFDARLPKAISEADEQIIRAVATNLRSMLSNLEARESRGVVTLAPAIPGYSWIRSGIGDFSLGDCLIEVKCTSKPFGAADIRQVLMYWMLSYASALEGKGFEWLDVALVNPRLNTILQVNFNELIRVVGAGRSKVELLELFSAMVVTHPLRMSDAI